MDIEQCACCFANLEESQIGLCGDCQQKDEAGREWVKLLHEDWPEFSLNGQRWSFGPVELALWDDEEEGFHFYANHGLAEPTVESLIRFIEQQKQPGSSFLACEKTTKPCRESGARRADFFLNVNIC